MKKVIFLYFFIILKIFADDYHYQNVIIGERAFGLGGAFTAIANDSSGCYYNPAGIPYLERSTFSLTSTIYSLEKQSTENVFNFVANSTTTEATSSQLVPIPSTVATLKKLNDRITTGICAIVQNFKKISLDSKVTSDTLEYSLRRVVSDQTIFVGIPFGIKVIGNLSIGFTLFYVNRAYSLTNTITNLPPNQVSPPITISTADFFFSHNSLQALSGIRFSPYENFRIGFTYRTPQKKFSSDGSSFITIVDQNNNFISGANYNQAFKELQVESHDNPQRFVFAIAYEKPKKFATTFDFSYYVGSKDFSLTKLTIGEDEIPIGKIFQKNIYNYNIGLEYYLKPTLALRGGFYTNYSSNRLTPDGIIAAAALGAGEANQDMINLFGTNLSLGYETQYSSFTLGVGTAWGSGKTSRSFGEQSGEIYIRSMSETYLNALLGGSFYFD
jgi:long-chain fatty acid transport protein